jgi:pyruvate dehydrogenase E1 component alpha subunit
LLEAKIIDDKDIEKIQEDVKQLIDNAVKFAEESPEPDVTEVMGWVYA